MQMWHIILFVGAIILVMWGISIYFIQTGKMKATDWFARTLGLPSGSIRAIIAILIIFMAIYPLITVTGDTKLPELPQWLTGILGTVIGFYFGASTAITAGKKATTDSSGTSGSGSSGTPSGDTEDSRAKK